MLGAFDDTAVTSALTPQIALAASVLYMMSADGSMAAEEVGQLQVVIGQSQTLLKASLKYVKEIKFHQFIKLAAPLLNQSQRLCVLMNVCDSMLADGRIDILEKNLFKRMLAEFGVSEANFNGHFKNLFLKNEKPQDIRKSGFKESRNKHDFERIKSKDDAQQHFDRTIEGQDPNLTAPPALAEQSELGTAITRTMQENISKLSGEMASEQVMIVMAENANEYEKEDGVTSVRHQVDAKALADPVAQKITHGGDSTAARAITDNVEKAAGVGGSKTERNGLVDSSPALKDIAGAAEIRGIRDAEGASDMRSMRDAEGDTDLRILVDSESHDNGAMILARIDYLQNWTNDLKTALDKYEDIHPHQLKQRGIVLDAIAFKPDYPVELANHAASR